jgi:hypothetical protein
METEKAIDVFRGGGSGWFATGLVADVGDTVRVTADPNGRTKNNRVFGPQIVGPMGWPQPIPGAADYMFPLGNRPPHSLIARFGDRMNPGIDQTGGPRIVHVSSGGGASDSFFVGEAATVVVGVTGAAEDPAGDANSRVYRRTGPIWLGINDSEAGTQGDPSYKIRVTVRLKKA